MLKKKHWFVIGLVAGYVIGQRYTYQIVIETKEEL